MKFRKKESKDWLSLEEALKALVVWANVDLKYDEQAERPSQSVLLQEGLGRVLSQDLNSPFAIPRFDNSAMDGYALRFQDWEEAASDQYWPVSQRVIAGLVPESHQLNTFARIFTGAALPVGTDTVVPQEDVTVTDEGVLVKPTARLVLGKHVRKQGEEFSKNQTILTRGTRLCAEHLGLFAQVGKKRVKISNAPRVALVSTGNELLAPGKALKPGKIYNSNATMIQSLLNRLGVTEIESLHLEDDFDKTAEAMNDLSGRVDVIVTTGGVSVGEEDHISAFLSKEAVLKFWKVAMKPGKPVAFAVYNETPVLGLPGNPVAAYVCFQWFVRPLMLGFQGASMAPPLPYTMPIAADVLDKSPRDRFVRAKPREHKTGEVVLGLFASDSSSFLTSLCWGEGLARIPKDTQLQAGEMVSYYPFNAFS